MKGKAFLITSVIFVLLAVQGLLIVNFEMMPENDHQGCPVSQVVGDCPSGDGFAAAAHHLSALHGLTHGSPILLTLGFFIIVATLAAAVVAGGQTVSRPAGRFLWPMIYERTWQKFRRWFARTLRDIEPASLRVAVRMG